MPDLPDLWKDASENYRSLFTELESGIINSYNSDLPMSEDTSISQQNIEMSNERVASIIELINNLSINANLASLENPLYERPHPTVRPTYKKSRSRHIKIPVTHGFGEKLNLDFDSALPRGQEGPRQVTMSPWKPAINYSVPSPSNSLSIFQEFESTDEPHNNNIAGFSGEYFV